MEGQEYRVELLPRVKIAIRLIDKHIAKTQNTIARSARTGEKGGNAI
ncbi:hypothetical protein ACFLUY_03795 [Chloroflexota bacterium]